MTNTFYYFGLGSNLGHREANIHAAIRLLGQRVGNITSSSPCIETEPWGYESPHPYLNAAVALITDLEPDRVLAITQEIERELGRTAKTHDGHYEDRIIDIDILVCEHHVIYSPDLRLPHPRMWQRPFVTDTLAALSDSECCPYADTEPRVATIGFFDGAHRGHQHLARQLADLNRGRSHRALMLTFDRHPHDVVHPDEAPVPLLTTLTQKRMQFFRYNKDIEMWFLQFTPYMAALTARQFMEYVLRDQLNVDTLLIGYDHHFGRPLPGETFDDYVRYGAELGIRIVRATELPDDLHVSSSAIRRAIMDGDFAAARTMLGRDFLWWGRVVHGEALGRRLGFPTANLVAKHPDIIIPPRGVYAAWVSIPGKPQLHFMEHGTPFDITFDGDHEGPHDGRYMAMVNIGTRPTVTQPATDDAPRQTIEAHILDFDGDIYGQELCLTLVARLRDEQHFDSEADLVRQLQADREAVRHLLNH